MSKTPPCSDVLRPVAPSLFLSSVIFQVFPGDQYEVKEDQPRRRGSHTDSVGGVLSRTHELADHFQQHVSYSALSRTAVDSLTAELTGRRAMMSFDPSILQSCGKQHVLIELEPAARINSRPQAIFSSMKVVQAPVPIIRGVALSDRDVGSDGKISFNFDISIDGPTHSGLATSAFTSYLSDHLPNLAPLTMVLKKLLQVG